MDPRVYNIDDMELLGTSRYHMYAKGYFNGGANDEISLRAQRQAFDKIKLKQRTFVDRSQF